MARIFGIESSACKPTLITHAGQLKALTGGLQWINDKGLSSADPRWEVVMTVRKSKAVSLLEEVLERRMVLYALAVGATLVGATAAQGKIVFTPSNEILKHAGFYKSNQFDIDLNNDGVTDIVILNRRSLFSNTLFLSARGYQLGDAVGVENNTSCAAATERGVTIGSEDHFRFHANMAVDTLGPCPWRDVSNRFLAVRFMINGELHYGWVGFRHVNADLDAHFYGWAYETEANTPIITGDKGEQPESAMFSSVEPTSLELLAMGHTGIADRQRRMAVQANS